MEMEKMFEFLKPDFENIDDRGELKQLYSKSCKQVNYSFSKKGTFRGNHYHKINKEIFYMNFRVYYTKETKILIIHKVLKLQGNFLLICHARNNSKTAIFIANRSFSRDFGT